MESFHNELSLVCFYNLLIIFGKVIKQSVCIWWCLPSAWLAAASPLTFILFFLLVFFLSLMGDDGVRSFPREGLIAPSMLDSAGWRQGVKHLETKPLSHIIDLEESIPVKFIEFLHMEKFTQELLSFGAYSDGGFALPKNLFTYPSLLPYWTRMKDTVWFFVHLEMTLQSQLPHQQSEELLENKTQVTLEVKILVWDDQTNMSMYLTLLTWGSPFRCCLVFCKAIDPRGRSRGRNRDSWRCCSVQTLSWYFHSYTQQVHLLTMRILPILLQIAMHSSCSMWFRY